MTDHSDLIEIVQSAAEISGDELLHAAASALSSQSLSLSEAREDRDSWRRVAERCESEKQAGQATIKRMDRAASEANALYLKMSAERDALKGALNLAMRRLKEISTCAAYQPRIHAGAGVIEIDAALNARSALEDDHALLADATNDPADLSSLRKGAEVVGEAAAYDFVAGWHERQAKLFREMAEDDPRTAKPARDRAKEAAIHQCSIGCRSTKPRCG